MSFAVDTNILARSVQENHPMLTVAKESVKTLPYRGEEVYLLTQNLHEFWSPRRDG
jgi:hypothetical protein